MEEKKEKTKKKKVSRSWGHTSFYISDAYKETHENLKKLCEIDRKDNEEFRYYCKRIEKIDLDNYDRSVFGVYLRFILTIHAKLNENRKKLQ